jgi:hypothetical protein
MHLPVSVATLTVSRGTPATRGLALTVRVATSSPTTSTSISPTTTPAWATCVIALTAIGGPTLLHPHEQLATIRPQVTFRRGASPKGEADIHSEPTGPVEYAKIEYGGLPGGANCTATRSITSDDNAASVCVLGSHLLSDEEPRCTDLAMSGGDVPAIHEGLA